MTVRRYRPVAVVLVLLHLNACTSWQPISVQDGPVPERVRVTTDNEQFVLSDTRLVGDTAIAGTWSGTPVGITPSAPIVADGLRTVRLIDVLRVESGSFSPLKTIGLVAGIGVAILGAMYLLACSDSDAFC